jgi:L-arabonate dehydrase
MGAASVDLPTMVVPGGPMLNGKYSGQDIGSGTHVWKFSDDVRTGQMTIKIICLLKAACRAAMATA